MDSKQCPKCHQEISADSQFCSKCGCAIIPQETIKKPKSKAIYVLAIVLVLAIAIILSIIIAPRYTQHKNLKLKRSAYSTAETGDLNKALEIADKIKDDFPLQQETKQCIVLSSYLSNCKDVFKQKNLTYYCRFFGDSKSFTMISYDFYDISYYRETDSGYPTCVISGNDQYNDRHYFVFKYDDSTKNYSLLGNVKGLQVDSSIDETYDFDKYGNESYMSIQDFYGIQKDNTLKEMIMLLQDEIGNLNVDYQINSFAQNENYTNIELLKPYHEYF